MIAAMARSPLFAALRRALRTAELARRTGREPAELLAAAAIRRERDRDRGLDRRTLLRSTLGAAALVPLAAAACGDNVDGSARVAVIGAGTAGLHCAVRLAEAGVDVTVYEASGRTGGRMFTDRGPYPDGKVIELGGELIDTGHTVMQDLAAELGLTLDDLAAGDAGVRGDTFYFDGQIISAATLATEFAPLATRMAMAAASEDTPSEFERLDNLSIPQWLAGDGMLPPTSLIRRILERAYIGEYGLEVEEQTVWNLLWLIDFETADPFRIYGDSDERYHLHEGNQAVPDGLAAQLPGRIELGHELVAVTTRSDGRPVLTFDTDGGTVETSPDRVVFALPFTLLRRLDLTGAGLTDGKQTIIRNLGYGTNAKLMMRFGSRPWRTTGLASGGAVSDLGAMQATWETSRGYGGVDGILTNFVGGNHGVAMGMGSAEDRAAETLPWIDTVFPGTQAAYLAGSAVRQHWPTAPFALGSYACYKLGQGGFAGLEGEAEGAFHFCGEHTSVEAQGYMEGAAETGLRAADEVLTEFGLPAGPAMRRMLARAAAKPRRRRRHRGT